MFSYNQDPGSKPDGHRITVLLEPLLVVLPVPGSRLGDGFPDTGWAAAVAPYSSHLRMRPLKEVAHHIALMRIDINSLFKFQWRVGLRLRLL